MDQNVGRADSRTLNSDTELCDLQQVIGFLWTPVPRSVACGTWITVDAVCTPPPRSPLSSVLPDSSCSACWLRTVPSCPLSGDPLSLKEATSSAGGGRGWGAGSQLQTNTGHRSPALDSSWNQLQISLWDQAEVRHWWGLYPCFAPSPDHPLPQSLSPKMTSSTSRPQSPVSENQNKGTNAKIPL